MENTLTINIYWSEIDLNSELIINDFKLKQIRPEYNGLQMWIK